MRFSEALIPTTKIKYFSLYKCKRGVIIEISEVVKDHKKTTFQKVPICYGNRGITRATGR